MTDDQLRREALFIASMEAFAAMHDKGIITDRMYTEAERRMAEKYHPFISRLKLTK